LKPFTVVIPLIPQHDSKIRDILSRLVFEQELIEEVILCRSESIAHSSILTLKFSLLAKTLKFNPPVTVNAISGVARDGTNRNRGWENSRTKYVAFIDADDFYFDGRLKLILHLLELTNADAIIHDYANQNEIEEDRNIENLGEFRTAPLYAGSMVEDSGLREILDEFGKPVQAHFAHITVKNAVREQLQFTSKFPGADWEFVVNLIENGFNLQYIPLKLSAWSRSRSFRYYLRLFRMRYFKKATTFFK